MVMEPRTIIASIFKLITLPLKLCKLHSLEGYPKFLLHPPAQSLFHMGGYNFGDASLQESSPAISKQLLRANPSRITESQYPIPLGWLWYHFN